jgi:hypothetical protein
LSTSAQHTYRTAHWQLLRDLKTLDPLPSNAVIYSTDAVLMFTNIDIDHDIETLDKWFDLHQDQLPPSFPRAKILDGLDIIMRNNILSFGDDYFIQKNGTTMGTSTACAYVTIYYYYHEEL